MNRFLSQIICLISVSLMTGNLSARQSDSQSNWGNFRGPEFTGVSPTAKPPTQWSAEKNVKWKVKVPGVGSSSPAVWGDKIFLTTAINQEPNAKKPPRLDRRELFKKFDENADGQLSGSERQAAQAFLRERAQAGLSVHQFLVLCYDRETGEKVWEKTAAQRKPVGGHHGDGTYASASPVTDGKHLYINFGSMGLYCFDLQGNEIWKRTDLGEMRPRGEFGEGSSVAISEKLVLLPWDHEGQSKIEAIDRFTGKTVWKQDRDEPSAWATPVVTSINGKGQVIHAGDNFSRGYDLAEGKELWRSSGLSLRPVATPVVFNNLGIFSSSRRGSNLNAYYLDKTGDISSTPAWKIDRHSSDCPSLLLSESRLFYVGGNNAMISCANAKDGSQIFDAQRLPGLRGVYSSPIAADGKVFITGRNGVTAVIKDGTEFESIAKNDIGEPVDATLAAVGTQLFIRGKDHLFCIEE